MPLRPFSLLHPFQKKLTVTLLAKDDAVRTDADVAEKTGVRAIASLKQMHGNRAIRVTGPTSRIEEADAMATDVPGLLLTIRAADCQNMVVYAPQQHVIGVLHVGWRCLEAGTIGSFYELLKAEWGIEPADTYVCNGPSLGAECAEFSDPDRELPSVPSTFKNGKFADLSGAADRQLDELGVPRSQRERIADCTKCHPEKYWTYRGGDREKVIGGWTNVLACMLS